MVAQRLRDVRHKVIKGKKKNLLWVPRVVDVRHSAENQKDLRRMKQTRKKKLVYSV